MLQDLAIFGAGGLGREVAVLVHQINTHQPQWNLIGFFDDKNLSGQQISGIPYLGDLQQLNKWPEPIFVVFAVGNAHTKKQHVAQVTNQWVQYPVLCHPDSVTMPQQAVTFAEGTIICRGVLTTANISIGRHVLLNLAISIGHDVQIDDFCSLMPGVRISGECTLHEAVYVGTNAALLNQITIGSGTTIGAGAVVTKSLPAHVTAVGVPARIIKNHS